METKKRFRPTIRQYRILEAANKELSSIQIEWIKQNAMLTSERNSSLDLVKEFQNRLNEERDSKAILENCFVYIASGFLTMAILISVIRRVYGF